MAKPTPTPSHTTPILPDPGTFFGQLTDGWHLDVWLPRAAWALGLLVVLLIAHSYGLGFTLIRAVIRRDWDLARSAGQAARIRRRWGSTAQHLKLVLTDRTAVTAANNHANGLNSSTGTTPKPKTVVPRLRVKADPYGIVGTARTLPGVGLDEWLKASRHLADEWRAVRVAVNQDKPGRIRVRAVRRDPLGLPTSYEPDPDTLTAPTTLDSLPVGLDEYAEPVELRLSNVAGICVCGLPGYGKTSFLNGVITRLAPHPAVQFIGLDGKVDNGADGDYADVAQRFTILLGDDLEKANELLAQLVEFRRARKASIRALLGVKNVWHAGFTPDWPLIILIIDEAHTYFATVKDGGNPDLKRRNALASQNALYVEDLIKKGRDVGILTILATQKGTGDAIPTQIRDVCSVSLAFACRTIEAAVAALGEDIRQYPDVNPVKLRDPQYVGVAVMAVQGREGFTRVRMPYVPDPIAAAVAERHAQLVLSRGTLPAAPAATAAIGTGEPPE
jgi:DNA segregation ATPase FtsK/SpoIIIE, S-DNA-T family